MKKKRLVFIVILSVGVMCLIVEMLCSIIFRRKDPLSEDVIVAVIDTGVDTKCDVFSKTKILVGWDFYNEDDILYDDYLYDYHGTYVCTKIVEHAPGITILPVKFMEATYGSVKDAIRGIDYAISKGAQIINCSWNFNEYDEELYNLMEKNSNVLFVCAAGNYSINIDETPIYPCSYNLPNIINVLATDNNGNVYATSGYGQETVHVGAAGEKVQVILPENDVGYIDGTSVATAIVCAKAASLKAEDINRTPQEIKNIIIENCDKTNKLKNKCVSGGVVN